MTADVSPRSSLVVESLLFARSYMVRWRTQPLLPIQSLLFPTLLLIVYHLLVGESLIRITGTDNLTGLVPMCAIAGGMFGALGAGFAIPHERRCGLLSRLWAFPVHRSSALIGRLLAEAVRTLLSVVLITAVGIALGLRFEGSWLAVIPYLLVPVAVVVTFAAVVTTLALAVGPDGSAMFTWLGTASIGLVFGSSGVAPMEMFPSWLRPLIQFQPMSPPIETMRALCEGNPVFWPMLATLGWVLAFAAVFGPLAIRNYRIAAETGV
ncbi:MAG TPA: ABC transporter permease [Mycobacterium sp.]|nr:ABC transporter permease [Mycobacterium sp.]